MIGFDWVKDWEDKYGGPTNPLSMQYNPKYEQQQQSAALVSKFEQMEKAAREANIKREQEIRDIYSKLISQDYGAFRTAGEFDIAQAERQAIGQGIQQMISSGLYGTTTAAAIPMQAKAQSQSARLKLEDIIQQRKSEAQLGLAGFIERIEEPYPDLSALYNAMAAAAS